MQTATVASPYVCNIDKSICKANNKGCQRRENRKSFIVNQNCFFVNWMGTDSMALQKESHDKGKQPHSLGFATPTLGCGSTVKNIQFHAVSWNYFLLPLSKFWHASMGKKTLKLNLITVIRPTMRHCLGRQDNPTFTSKKNYRLEIIDENTPKIFDAKIGFIKNKYNKRLNGNIYIFVYKWNIRNLNIV